MCVVCFLSGGGDLNASKGAQKELTCNLLLIEISACNWKVVLAEIQAPVRVSV